MTAVPTQQTRAPFSLRFLLALLLLGITQLIAQVVLTRELLAVFLGNELSIALVLASWLVMVAAGSVAGAWLVPRLRNPIRAFAWAQMSIAPLAPLALLVARCLQPGPLTPGQVLPPGAMLLTSLQALSVVCFIGGLQFVFGARAAEAVWGSESRPLSPLALVYALEAAGAVVGGIAFHLYLAEHVSPFRTLAAVGLLNIISASALLRPRFSLREARPLLASAVLGAGLLMLAALAGRAEIASLRASARWSHLRPVAFLPSKYGALVVAEREHQVSLFQSGILLFTSQDDQLNEIAVHLPLLEHARPRRVLLVGGAVAGGAGEVLKHPVARLDCIELDPKVVDLARQWLPLPLLLPLEDERVRLHLGDARLFVKAARGRYDVIILNTPDPTTASLNRFYTLEFLREARRALAPGGILSLRLTGSEVHLSGTPLRAAATAQRTLARVFPAQLLVPGERMFFLAAEQQEDLSSDWQLLSGRLRSRGVATEFVNEAWLQDALLPFRGELIRQVISAEPDPHLNTDLNPVSYYHQTRIWLDQVSPALARWARLLTGISLWWALPPLLLAALAAAVSRGRGGRFSAAAVLIAAAAVGGFGLVVEVLALLAFQSACGYLYHSLGVLIASFMAGLAVGSAFMGSRRSDRRSLARLLVAGLTTAVAICALLPGHLRAVLPLPALAPFALGLLLFVVGFLVGAMFPVAAALYRRERGPAAAGGAIYAADLVGSAGAAVIAGGVAVPLLGVSGAAYGTALLLGAALLLALPLAGRSTAQP